MSGDDVNIALDLPRPAILKVCYNLLLNINKITQNKFALICILISYSLTSFGLVNKY